jgi:hypothetical protein
MPLLKTPRRRLAKRSRTVIRCPLNGLQVSWCRNLCEPIEGDGLCGRPAPHALVGRTQAAIAAYQARKHSND